MALHVNYIRAPNSYPFIQTQTDCRTLSCFPQVIGDAEAGALMMYITDVVVFLYQLVVFSN
jgi:hypothetical protein